MGSFSDNPIYGERSFTKNDTYHGRLSTISERDCHEITQHKGIHRYLVQFQVGFNPQIPEDGANNMKGMISPADGIGFIFSKKLPCPKNIQKFVSVFMNQKGHINLRVFDQIHQGRSDGGWLTDVLTGRSGMEVPGVQIPYEHGGGNGCVIASGHWVEMAIDLNRQVAEFLVWAGHGVSKPHPNERPLAHVRFPYGHVLQRHCGTTDSQGQPVYRVWKEDGTGQPIDVSAGHLACVIKNSGVRVNLCS